MITMASEITVNSTVWSPACQANNKYNIITPYKWPIVGEETTGDGWVLLTNGPVMPRFHGVASSFI